MLVPIPLRKSLAHPVRPPALNILPQLQRLFARIVIVVEDNHTTTGSIDLSNCVQSTRVCVGDCAQACDQSRYVLIRSPRSRILASANNFFEEVTIVSHSNLFKMSFGFSLKGHVDDDLFP